LGNVTVALINRDKCIVDNKLTFDSNSILANLSSKIPYKIKKYLVKGSNLHSTLKSNYYY
jgi:hypothetical protein